MRRSTKIPALLAVAAETRHQSATLFASNPGNSSLVERIMRSLGAAAVILLVVLTGPLEGFGQTFVNEWTASADGGVGPTGMVLATEGGVTYLYVADQP